jgi:hypothetical protein
MMTTLIVFSVFPFASTLDDSIHRRVLSVLAAEGFVQLMPIRDYASDMPFGLRTVFGSEARMLSVKINGGHLPRGMKEGRLEGWGLDSATTPPEGSLSGLPLGERCSHDWGDQKYGGFVRSLVDRYDLTVFVSVPMGKEPLTDPVRDQYAKTLCERIARVVLADAMAIDLADDGRELGTSRMTGNEAPKDGYVTLESWAAASGVPVSFDAKTASASFTVNYKAVRLLLASDKAIVDGQQIGLGGKFILARGARWFIPDRELTAAVR